MRSRQVVSCPACGATGPAGARTCRRCGNDLRTPVSWREPEPDERTEVIVERPRAVPRIPDRPRRGGSRRRGLALVALGLALVTAGAYVGFRAGAGTRSLPAASGPGVAPTTSAGGPSRAVTSAPTSRSPELVQVAPALETRPGTAEVRRVLTAYFSAINRRDFAAYRATLVDRGGLPETRADFDRRYRSTQDSDVRLLGLRAVDGGGYVASVGFTSRQDPADAPDGGSDCLRWSVAFPLVRTDGPLRIDSASLTTIVRRPC